MEIKKALLLCPSLSAAADILQTHYLTKLEPIWYLGQWWNSMGCELPGCVHRVPQARLVDVEELTRRSPPTLQHKQNRFESIHMKCFQKGPCY